MRLMDKVAIITAAGSGLTLSLPSRITTSTGIDALEKK